MSIVPALLLSVNPARAGMILSRLFTKYCRQSKPHASGDDPAVLKVVDAGIG